jgi:hypothetical protein
MCKPLVVSTDFIPYLARAPPTRIKNIIITLNWSNTSWSIDCTLLLPENIFSFQLYHHPNPVSLLFSPIIAALLSKKPLTLDHKILSKDKRPTPVYCKQKQFPVLLLLGINLPDLLVIELIVPLWHLMMIIAILSMIVGFSLISKNIFLHISAEHMVGR